MSLRKEIIKGGSGRKNGHNRLSLSAAKALDLEGLSPDSKDDVTWLRETCEFYQGKSSTHADTIKELEELEKKLNSEDNDIRDAALRHLHFVRNVGVFDTPDTPKSLLSPRSIHRGGSAEMRPSRVMSTTLITPRRSDSATHVTNDSFAPKSLLSPPRVVEAGSPTDSPIVPRRGRPLRRLFAGKAQTATHMGSEPFEEERWMRPVSLLSTNEPLPSADGGAAHLMAESEGAKKFTVCAGGPSGSLAEDSKELRMEDFEAMRHFYNDYFLDRPHVLYVGRTDSGDPLCVAVEVPASNDGRNDRGRYRVLILSRTGYTKWWLPSSVSTRERLRLLRTHPELSNCTLRKSRQLQQLSTQLMIFEQKRIVHHFKFGVLYRRKGQFLEEEIFSNEHGSAQFYSFMKSLGGIIKLRNYKGFRGGLDVRDDLTGSKTFQRRVVFDKDGCLLGVGPEDKVPYDTLTFDVIYHVAPLLPHDPSNPQQIHKKRHIGNDIVVVVFCEGNEPIDPSVFTSNYNHVFILVRPVPDDPTGRKKRKGYKVCTASLRGVTPWRPYIPKDGFVPLEGFGSWLLMKMINAEIAAMQAPEFAKKSNRTIQQVLGSFVDDYG